VVSGQFFFSAWCVVPLKKPKKKKKNPIDRRCITGLGSLASSQSDDGWGRHAPPPPFLRLCHSSYNYGLIHIHSANFKRKSMSNIRGPGDEANYY
jgi:hypothetical protein